MTGKKILFFSVSAGAGHTKAAEALCTAAASLPATTTVTTRHLDVMRLVPWGLRKLYVDAYLFLVRRWPVLWGVVYRVTNDANPNRWSHRLRRRVDRLCRAPMLRAIDEFRPDVIVCTHFLPAELLSNMVADGSVRCPVWVQITDFDLHRLWIQPHVTGYFAPNEEVALRLRDAGMAADRIHVTGIPVSDAFAAPPDRMRCARDIGLDPQRPTLLMMGGGAGLGCLSATAERLLALRDDIQIIAIAGHNAAALRELQAIAAQRPGRLAPFGYTDAVAQLMACADLIVTKPGGLTTAECLAMGLPMIVNAPIPGQEESNANFLLEQGVALKSVDAASLDYRIEYLLARPDKLADMRRRASALGRPQAARHILNTVLGHAEPQPCHP